MSFLGANVNFENVQRDETLLHFACQRSGADIVGQLIDNGANVNAKNSNEDTPLHLASFYNNIEAARCLLLNKRYTTHSS